MHPLLLSMQYVLCINGSSKQRWLTTLPPNMTRWNVVLRLVSKDFIMLWTKWLVVWLSDLVTIHSTFKCLRLPTWIYDTLLECNILPEFCTLEDIHENSRQIEEISLHV